MKIVTPEHMLICFDSMRQIGASIPAHLRPVGGMSISRVGGSGRGIFKLHFPAKNHTEKGVKIFFHTKEKKQGEKEEAHQSISRT
jgi:hypothetical protein